MIDRIMDGQQSLFAHVLLQQLTPDVKANPVFIFEEMLENSDLS